MTREELNTQIDQIIQTEPEGTTFENVRILLKSMMDYVDQISLTPGLSAYEIAVENGFTGTQSEWLISLEGNGGDTGASAYDIAVANGFVGTEVEWLESLKTHPNLYSYIALLNQNAEENPIPIIQVDDITSGLGSVVSCERLSAGTYKLDLGFEIDWEKISMFIGNDRYDPLNRKFIIARQVIEFPTYSSYILIQTKNLLTNSLEDGLLVGVPIRIEYKVGA